MKQDQLRSYLMLALAALALLNVAGAASASTKQEMNAAFREYGFEYREAERPYGLPITARLTQVKIEDKTLELDLASPLTRQGVDSAIHDYLLRHAANELHVISMLVGEPMGNIKINPDKAFVLELRSDLIKPPFESWRAQLESFKDKGVTIDAHCDFHFVRLAGKYYQLYFEDRGSYKTSNEPSCDVRRSDFRHTVTETSRLLDTEQADFVAADMYKRGLARSYSSSQHGPVPRQGYA